MEKNKKYHLPEYITYSKVDGEIVIFHGENNHYYSLNNVGSSVFRKVEQGKSKSEIFEELINEYRVEDEDALKEDVEEILLDLISEGIIEEGK